MLSTATCAPCQRAAVGNNLNAALVSNKDIEVHVAHGYIGRHPGARFSAHPRGGTLQRNSTRAKDPRIRTSSAVVAKWVKKTATRALPARGGQHTKAAKEEHTHV